jgi:hypothetical protein
MNRYQPEISRTAAGLTAVGLAAIVIGMAVVAPAQMTPGDARLPAVTTTAAPAGTMPRLTEALVAPACVEVVGERVATLIHADAHGARPAFRHET